MATAEPVSPNNYLFTGGVLWNYTPPSEPETWVLNSSIQFAWKDDHQIEGAVFYTNFTANNTSFNRIDFNYDSRTTSFAMNYDNITVLDGVNEFLFFNPFTAAYQTITLEEPATGDFLTWLEANAVKQ